MNYFSCFSGIEAASVAWKPLGWKAVGFSEIEPFPSAVLAHHFPNIKNYGDITKYNEWGIAPGSVDLVVGGSPCQAFSVAGLRQGLADPRGNLALVFLGLVDRLRPRWVIWENVPGVLSSNGGEDFAAFISALGQLGYGWSYRVLDAQFFGVPQRRRRVFLVASSTGDWRPCAEVLSLAEGLRGYLEEGGKKGEAIASGSEGGVDEDGLQRTVGTLCADTHPGAYSGQDAYSGRLIPYRKSKRAQSDKDYETWVEDTKSNTINVFDAGDIRTTHAVVDPIAIQATIIGRGEAAGPQGVGAREGGPMYTLTKADIHGVATPMMFKVRGGVETNNGSQGGQVGKGAGKGFLGSEDKAFTIATAQDQWLAQPDSKKDSETTMAVRRLTPLECERLQGFPDNWTLIPWKGRPPEECPDGPRYKACGNSMAVPVMAWIGKQIANYEASQK